MKNGVIRVLLVDDDEDDFFLTQDILSDIEPASYEVEWADTFEKGKQIILSKAHDVYLIDFRLGEFSGIDLIHEAIRLGCTAPIILLTGEGDKRVDLEAMKAGAYDYLVKGEINKDNLERAIRYAIERNRSHNIIKEQEAKYRVLFEQSADAIFILNKELCFVDVNTSLFELMGHSPEEILESTIKDFFISEQDCEEFIRQNRKNRFVKDFYATFRRKQGEKVECLISSAAIVDVEGEITGYQGIIHDITQYRKAEKEIRQVEKLSLTGRLARTIAHEVRNPLTNIDLALDQLNSELENKAEDFKVYTGIIKRNSGRINELITELLNSAKPTEPNLEKQSINEVVDEVLKLSQDRINLIGVELIKNYQYSDGEISFDADKMKVALLNIITNAIEAMEDVSAPCLKVYTIKNDKKCLISIEDNGVGMNEETKNKLFDPFFTGKRDGMGLGMTSVQNIIKSHNGSIEVESEEGKGTKFVIQLNCN